VPIINITIDVNAIFVPVQGHNLILAANGVKKIQVVTLAPIRGGR